MSFDLTNKNIQDTFQNLLQRTGSDNRLYDLTGNEIGDLKISGSLTAQQYIVSSSVTNITTQQLSGSTIFGNSSDDTHTFIGNITSSGNISASGNIFANSGSFNYITASKIDVDASTIRIGGEELSKANLQTLRQGKSLKALGPGKVNPDILGGDITASGDIKINGNILNTQEVQMTNSSSVIDTFNTGSFRSTKYILQVTSASNFQLSEMLVLHHNSTASSTEYAQINSGLNLVNFSTDIFENSVRLNASGNFLSCSVRYERTIIPI